MAVTIIQKPNLIFDQAYGPNPVTLGNITTSEDKYILQVLGSDGVTILADVRQTPNKVGRAIFDLQNILQSYVGPSLASIEKTGAPGTQPLTVAAKELMQYKLRFGSETNGNINYLTTDTTFLYAFGGKKDYYQVNYDANYYIPTVSGNGQPDGCTLVTKLGLPFSDNTVTKSVATITDGVPSMLFGQLVDVRDVYPSDMTTVTFYNGLNYVAPSPIPTVKGIEAFRIIGYDATGTVTMDYYIENKLSTGGGPNLAIGSGTLPYGQYKAITVGTGPYNMPTLAANTHHYYVIPVVWTPTACSANNLTVANAYRAQRFNILQENCSDFSVIQFSWLNSLGFRDYYTFTKRHDRSVNIKKNTYLKSGVDYNSVSYQTTEATKGETVFSQTLEETFSANTGFLNDEEAKYLESLFISADVKVRFGDNQPTEWQPVVIKNARYEQKTVRKNKLFQYTVEFQRAHNIKSQKG